MPIGRCRPSAFGIQTRFEGFARYRPLCTRSWKPGNRFSNRSPYSCHVTSSTPDAASRSAGEGTCFARADLRSLPFRDATFDLVASFQVIEHLDDPSDYLAAIARLLKPEGLAILTTPNLHTSDRVNPYHVHEYLADELAALLGGYFGDVEMRGVGMTDAVCTYLAARSQRIRRILRLDPLQLRGRLPLALSQTLFSWCAVLVRLGSRSAPDSPEADWRQFPIGRASDDCLDLLALCRRPR